MFATASEQEGPFGQSQVDGSASEYPSLCMVRTKRRRAERNFLQDATQQRCRGDASIKVIFTVLRCAQVGDGNAQSANPSGVLELANRFAPCRGVSLS